jgi:hypothetical protein
MIPNQRKDYPPVNIRDGNGNIVNFQFTSGELAVFDGSFDKHWDVVKHVSGFCIIPLTAGTIAVQLLSQDDSENYIFSAEEVNAHIGKMLPAKVKTIFATGTSVTNMKIVW